jgi:hypothetical protein
MLRHKPMTTYVGPKRTRVATDPKRRARGQAAVERMRDWHNKRTARCPVGSHDRSGNGVAWLGHCAHSVACAYKKSASGWNASQGWFTTPEKYRRTGRKSKTPPRGALVFWAGGSQGYGHVAVANGRGKVWGVDLPDSGHIGLIPIDEVARRWGLKYLGWIWPDQVAGW